MVWGGLTPQQAPSEICTGYRGSIEDMPVDKRLLRWAGTGERVLDLGAGVGRNTIHLARNFTYVVAYDLPNMCEMMRARSDWPPNAYVTSDWEEAAEETYDVVVSCLVLQHLDVGTTRRYLSELKCARLLVLSRTWIDNDAGAVLPLLEERFETIRILSKIPDHFYYEGRPLHATSV